MNRLRELHSKVHRLQHGVSWEGNFSENIVKKAVELRHEAAQDTQRVAAMSDAEAHSREVCK